MLGVSVGEPEMVFHEQPPMVNVGERKRLIRIREVETVLETVKNGERLRTKREFRAGEDADDT